MFRKVPKFDYVKFGVDVSETLPFENITYKYEILKKQNFESKNHNMKIET